MSQSGRSSLTVLEEGTLSSHESQILTGSSHDTMASKIPVPLNRKNNCPSRLTVCKQGGVNQNPSETNGANKEEKTETNDNGGGNKRLICKIRIKTGDEGTIAKPEENGNKKTVSMNTGEEAGDKKSIEPAKSIEEPCNCKKEEAPPKKEPFVPLSEIETTYYEHYVEELQSSTTGVQTELDNGSDSVDSLPGLPEAQWCGTGAELPWQKFILSNPGTYTIRSSKKEVENLTTIHIVCNKLIFIGA